MSISPALAFLFTRVQETQTQILIYPLNLLSSLAYSANDATFTVPCNSDSLMLSIVSLLRENLGGQSEEKGDTGKAFPVAA